MSDHLVRVLVQDADLRGNAVVATELCREACERHRAAPTAAILLSQTLIGGLLLARVHKVPRRVNLQIECDGPIRGLVVDATSEGTIRGFARVPAVHFPSDHGALVEPAFGTKGMVNVLREMNPGEWYQGTVELPGRSVPRGVEEYLRSSEQVESVVEFLVQLGPDGLPNLAVGVLFDRLPTGNPAALAAVQTRLAEGWLPDYIAEHENPAAGRLLDDLMEAHGGENLALLERVDVRFHCGCDRERVIAALVTLGREDLEEMIAEGEVPDITCEFCATVHDIGVSDLMRVRDALIEHDASA